MTDTALEPIGTDQNLNPYEALTDEDHIAAVDMRVDGFRYRYIAEQLKRSEQTIKIWFMHDGPCHDAYQHRKAEWLKETQTLHHQIRQKISAGAVDSVVTLHRNARKGSTIAAKTLLEMDGFKPTDRVELSVPGSVKFEYVTPARIDGQPTNHSAGAESQTG